MYSNQYILFARWQFIHWILNNWGQMQFLQVLIGSLYILCLLFARQIILNSSRIVNCEGMYNFGLINKFLMLHHIESKPLSFRLC